jgi:16S rRNA (guanine527-N7)-methyltransferase
MRQRSVDEARIAQLLEPFLRAPLEQSTNVCNSDPALATAPSVLSPAQLLHISTYIDILLRWNARINLTAVRDPEEIITRHFGESLFAARHLFPDGSAPSHGHAVSGGNEAVLDARATVAERGTVAVGGGRAALEGRVEGLGEMRVSTPQATRVADIGSGAGFPGLPLKIWAPDVLLTLIESNHKKAAFLREIVRALILTDVNVQNARAQTLTGTVFDIVTLRAVERFGAILPIASDLVGPSGHLALLISSAQQDEACSTLPNFTWSAPAPVPQSRSKVLLIGRKE